MTKRTEVTQKSSPPYFESENGEFILYCGNSIEILNQMNDIDVIFADPPYFLSNDGITCHAGRMVSVNKGKWDKSKGVIKNHKFNKQWLQACQKSLKKDGTIWVSGTHHIIYSVGFAMQEIGLKILNNITWFKPNAAPNLSCRYFTHSTETILWAAKTEKSKHYFDYPLMKSENGGKQMRDLWNFPTSPKREKIFGKHPTQKPLALLDRIIRASSKQGELVLDPFTGSSTTGIAAVILGRRFIGIDKEEEYLELSKKRYLEAQKQRRLSLP